MLIFELSDMLFKNWMNEPFFWMRDLFKKTDKIVANNKIQVF